MVSVSGCQFALESICPKSGVDPESLDEVECSEAYWDEAQDRDDLEILTELRELPLDAEGNLPRVNAW